MYEALRARDIYLVSACAAAGAGFLAFGTLLGDLLLAVADPRVRERTSRHEDARALVLLGIDRRSRRVRRVVARTESAESALRRPAVRAADARACRRRQSPRRMCTRCGSSAVSSAGSTKIAPTHVPAALVQRTACSSPPIPTTVRRCCCSAPMRYGRDRFSRLLHGSRATLALAVLATLLATLIGALVGGVAGYAGGRLDSVLSRAFRVRRRAAGDLRRRSRCAP